MHLSLVYGLDPLNFALMNSLMQLSGVRTFLDMIPPSRFVMRVVQTIPAEADGISEVVACVNDLCKFPAASAYADVGGHRITSHSAVIAK